MNTRKIGLGVVYNNREVLENEVKKCCKGI